MTYEVTMTKDYGNRKKYVTIVEAKDKIDSYYKARAKAAKVDWHNWRHTQMWDITFSSIALEK